MKSSFLKWMAPLLIILAGIGIMLLMKAMRPAPKKEVPAMQGVPVHVLRVEKKIYHAHVAGTGTVQAAQEITVMPQVSGRVSSVSASFVSGGFFRKGDLLFEIEDADYRLALEQAKARVANAEYEISVTESRARIARQEWERLEGDKAEKPNPLVLYEPQMKNARAALASAAAVLRQAELDLERTKIRAPFNALVRAESVEPGQFVRSGTSVAALVGTDSAEIIVPLPVEELKWLEIPKQAYGGKGSPAIITMNLGGTIHELKGNIIRSLREIDPKSRMLSVVVSVIDPYMLAAERSSSPLPVGAFVNVVFVGSRIPGAVSVPATAVREDSTVWIMEQENALRIRNVQIVRSERERVLITEGLSEGDTVVLTTITGAADGMKLKPVGEGKKK